MLKAFQEQVRLSNKIFIFYLHYNLSACFIKIYSIDVGSRSTYWLQDDRQCHYLKYDTNIVAKFSCQIC